MTARYLLDTNIVSTLAEEPHGRVAQKALAIGEARLVTSIVVACELRFGAVRVGSARLETALNAILGAMPVLPLEPGVEQHYAEIRSDLERRGKPIGAHALLMPPTHEPSERFSSLETNASSAACPDSKWRVGAEGQVNAASTGWAASRTRSR